MSILILKVFFFNLFIHFVFVVGIGGGSESFCFFFFFFKEILQSLETPKLIESPKLCSYFQSDVNRQQARFAKLAFREMMRNTYELLLKPKLYQS